MSIVEGPKEPITKLWSRSAASRKRKAEIIFIDSSSEEDSDDDGAEGSSGSGSAAWKKKKKLALLKKKVKYLEVSEVVVYGCLLTMLGGEAKVGTGSQARANRGSN
jgi:hypothetical protein